MAWPSLFRNPDNMKLTAKDAKNAKFFSKTFFDGLGYSKSYSLLPGIPRKL
jgi:hypothetical protein